MVKDRVGSLGWLRKQIEDADTDLLREMVKAVTELFMSAEASAVCGAPYRRASTNRVNLRNGYRERRWDTRVGTIDLAIPKLRKGTYFPEWLLKPRRRAERALMQVVTECYVRGVSTRRVDGLVQTLGLEGMSKSQVSEPAKELDPVVESCRNADSKSRPEKGLHVCPPPSVSALPTLPPVTHGLSSSFLSLSFEQIRKDR